jgi:hypothetical protein
MLKTLHRGSPIACGGLATDNEAVVAIDGFMTCTNIG